jgi:hypothetical protein
MPWTPGGAVNDKETEMHVAVATQLVSECLFSVVVG